MKVSISLRLLSVLVAGPAKPSEVVIQLDEYGVPHIFASSVEGGYYGLGYAQAEDVLGGILAPTVGRRRLWRNG